MAAAAMSAATAEGRTAAGDGGGGGRRDKSPGRTGDGAAGSAGAESRGDGRRTTDGFDDCKNNMHILPAIVRRVEEMVAAGDEVGAQASRRAVGAPAPRALTARAA